MEHPFFDVVRSLTCVNKSFTLCKHTFLLRVLFILHSFSSVKVVIIHITLCVSINYQGKKRYFAIL